MNIEVFENYSIPKAILYFAVPTMLGQLSTIIYNLTDTYFVSMTNNANVIAAVSLSMPVSLIIMSLGAVFGYGGSSYISRLLGSRNSKDISKVSSYCIYMGLFLSIIVTILGIVYLPSITHLVGGDSDTFQYTKDYLFIIIIGSIFTIYANMLIHIIRGIGSAKEATIGLLIGTVTNIVLDPLFIITLDMGVTGAALATIIGNAVSTLYYFIFFLYKDTNLSCKLRDFSFEQPIQKNVISIGIPGGLVTILMSFSAIFMNIYMVKYGAICVSALGITNKLNSFCVMLIVGLCQGVQPLIGYNYGANNLKKLKLTLTYSTGFGIALGMIFSIIFLLFSESLFSFFVNNAKMISIGSTYLKLFTISNVILAVSQLIMSLFQATGKGLSSLFLTLSKQFIFFVPAIILFNHLYESNGVVFGQVFADLLVTGLAIVIYLFFIKKEGIQHEATSE